MKPGIHNNVSIEKYHADRSIISSSGLKLAKISSRHLGYYITHEPEKKSAYDFGNAFETALIDTIQGTKEFEKTCVIFNPEERPQKDKGITSAMNQAWKKSIFDSNKYVIKLEGETESLEALRQMVTSVMAEPLIVELLSIVDYQKSFVWNDPKTGVKCKTRPDIAIQRKKVMLDIKTTKNASPQGFPREAANFEMPLQAIMQIEGAIQTGYLDAVDEYFWLAVEKTPPYNATLYRLQAEDRDWLHDRYELYLKRCKVVLEDLKKHKGNYVFCDGYNENADNKYGVIDLELPLFYK